MTKRFKFQTLAQLFRIDPNNKLKFSLFAEKILNEIRQEWMNSIFGKEEEIYKREYEAIPARKWDPYIDPPKNKWKFYTADDRPDYWQGTK